MENFILNHTYLIKFTKNGILNKNFTLNSITILLITEKAYHVRWNKGLNTETSWELIDEMHNSCSIIEDITNFIVVNIFNTKCLYCNGEGRITDNRTTAMFSVCPVCHGTKNVNVGI